MKKVYYVTTWDGEREKFTPQKGVRTGPCSLFGLRKALRKLNAMGYTAAKGGKFYNNTVLDIVKRIDFYRGRTTLHRTSIASTAPVHPPILTEVPDMNVRQQ